MIDDTEKHDPPLTLLWGGHQCIEIAEIDATVEEHFRKKFAPRPLRVRRSYVAERLLSVGAREGDEQVQHLGERIATCASGLIRCEESLCDSCAPRSSVKLRKSAERWMRRVPDSEPITMGTLTVHGESILPAKKILHECFRKLCRRDVFADVISGRGQIEAEPSIAGGWLTHLHFLSHSTKPFRGGVIADAWRSLLGGRTAGRAHVQPVTRRWSETDPTFLEGRGVHVQTLARRPARLDRRGGARVRTLHSRSTLGREVRLAVTS